MILSEALRTGVREIRTNKVRSILSFAAISVGVASLLYTLAQTRGMRLDLNKALMIMGPGRLEVEAKEGYEDRGISPGLTLEDAEAIKRNNPGLYMVYPKVRHWGANLVYGQQVIKRVWIEGTTPEWTKRDNVFTLRGRFINDHDVRTAARVAVLLEPGGWVKKPFWAKYYNFQRPFDKFMAHHDILGRRINIEDRTFTVIGILKKPPRDKDPRWFAWGDPHVIIPVTAFHRYTVPKWATGSPTAIDSIKIDTGDEKTLATVRRRVEVLIKARHRGEEDFEIKDIREEIEQQQNNSKKFLVAAIALGAVALLAGGIGIMNVTLATVFSRIKEIGIRRALGASKWDILAQFVVEAGLLGVAGGIAGVGLGLFGIQKLARDADQALNGMVWHHLLSAVAVAAAVSMVFSLYPAYQAANLDPVEALKNE